MTFTLLAQRLEKNGFFWHLSYPIRRKTWDVNSGSDWQKPAYVPKIDQMSNFSLWVRSSAVWGNQTGEWKASTWVNPLGRKPRSAKVRYYKGIRAFVNRGAARSEASTLGCLSEVARCGSSKGTHCVLVFGFQSPDSRLPNHRFKAV